MNLNLHFLVALVLLSWLSFPQVLAAPKLGQVETSGRVVSPEHKPLKGIDIHLWTRDGEQSFSTSTGADGTFSISHPQAEEVCIEVMPDAKTGLAEAFLEKVPGSTNHALLVQLHPGFVVSGRVTHNGKALKGLLLRITPADQIKESTTERKVESKDITFAVHGGGGARSAWNGHFQFVITPGAKKLVILNNHYDDLAAKFEKVVTVTSDMNLGDVEMPGKKQL